MTARPFVASLATCGLILAAAPIAAADTIGSTTRMEPHVAVSFAGAPTTDTASPNAWHDLFEPDDVQRTAMPVRGLTLPASAAAAVTEQGATTARPRAVQLSHGYEVRQKIHRLASWATLPMFVTEYALGQKLYEGTGSDGVKGAHGAVATGTAVLFGVNTVTGAWNLWEARNKPEGRTRRIIHSVLMLGADAGFAATGMPVPDIEDGADYSRNRSRHRTVALTSMGVATAFSV